MLRYSFASITIPPSSASIVAVLPTTHAERASCDRRAAYCLHHSGAAVPPRQRRRSMYRSAGPRAPACKRLKAKFPCDMFLVRSPGDQTKDCTCPRSCPQSAPEHSVGSA
eukprot:TRINITY_DN101108_c0_g1_i1.p1 TRINITY_DN101108_c0_g1~~TRINITY_DN101108_c0_g1_i1.p1  ORF type:complete len:123 (+),score=7.03 TRINITY_DN101108_c0_g1_i1:40-369(+)